MTDNWNKEPSIWLLTLKYYYYGHLNMFIFAMGFLLNTITLYILIFNKDMRKSTINIYLTVLTLYDNGVLIFSVLMLNIPAITDYQLQNRILALSTNIDNELIANNDDQQRFHSAEITSTTSILFSTNDNVINSNVPYDRILLQSLNESFNKFIDQCFNEQSSIDDANSHYYDINYEDNIKSKFDSLYCRLLLRFYSYETINTIKSMKIHTNNDNNSKSMRLKMDDNCLQILNETLTILDDNLINGQISLDNLEKFISLIIRTIDKNIMVGCQSDQQQQRQQYQQMDTKCDTYDDGSMLYSPLVYYVKLVYPLALIAQTGSIWTTCLITIERYLAICHPLMTMTLSTKARAIWALSILSIMAFIFNLPRFAEVDTSCNQVKATEFRHNKIYYQVYYIFLNLTFNYIIPLSLLFILNVKIYISVQQASKNRNNLTRARQSELHLASMFIAIVAIFIACNAPAFIVNCMEPTFEVGTPALEVMTIFSNILVCINSSINFIIYCVFGRKFRQKFLKLLHFKCFKICGNKRQRRPFSHITNSYAVNFTNYTRDHHDNLANDLNGPSLNIGDNSCKNRDNNSMNSLNRINIKHCTTFDKNCIEDNNENMTKLLSKKSAPNAIIYENENNHRNSSNHYLKT